MLSEEKHVCDSSRLLSPPTTESKTSEHNKKAHIHVKTETAGGAPDGRQSRSGPRKLEEVMENSIATQAQL